MRKKLNQSRGALITFEGGEGAGKTTQVRLLFEHCQQEKLPVIIAREPGSTLISEQIRQIILNPENSQMSALTELLLYEAARAQVYTQVVIPALAQGKIVLMDRSIDSSVVYQGMVRRMGVALVRRLNKIATDNTIPKLTFLLDLPVEIGFSRLSQRPLDRLEQEGRAFHQQVRDGYLKLLSSPDKKRVVLLNAQQTPEQLAAQVWQILLEKIN